MVLPWAFLALLCSTSVFSIPANVRDDGDGTIINAYRLPEYTVSHYDLKLVVPPESLTEEGDSYTGTVTITFSFVSVTDKIALHAHPDFITIDKVNFLNVDYDPKDYSVDETTSILEINTINEVTVGRTYTLTIDFTGRLSTKEMYGFYKSSYVDAENVTKYLATTQFEPTHARKAFPCFDEPSFKAKFDVTISYPKDFNILFNTVESKSETDDATGLTTTTFETTPTLSTYLIAFIISDFTPSTGEAINGIAFKVWSRDGEKADAIRKLATEIGSKVIEKLNAFTDYNYDTMENIKKMDQVAIPDFSAGAMENWGLVTYREAALLYDETESSNRYKQRITTVIAHEFTHQWFGDLVTCNWWSEIFLNEGFATYFEYHIANEIVSSDWELDKQFLIEQVHEVLVVDSFANSQALQSDANTPTEISNRFGAVSYNKGGSILRMIAHILGADNFKTGLQKYLKDNAYSSAKPEDLWEALNTVVSKEDLPADTFGDVMENWTKKSGYPLVTVKWNGKDVTVSQEQFLLSGIGSGTKWYVPISYTTSEDADKFVSTSPQVWLTPTDDVTITLPENANWIILNNLQTGYFRVNYDDYLWNKISAQLQSKNFGGVVDLNRANIIDDLFNLARANKVKYSLAFNVASFLTNDTSYYPWYAAFNGYDFLLKRVSETKLRNAITADVASLMKNLYESVPFAMLEPDDQIYTHKQVLALTWACKLGNEDCVEQSTKLFKEYKESEKRPDRNLRTIVYCNALRYSTDSSDWEFLWNAYLEASDLATEQVTILQALGCTKDTTLLKEYLTKTITDDSGIRTQDTSTAYSSVYNGNPEGVSVAFEFLKTEWKQIAEKYQTMNSLGNIVKGIAERFTTQSELDQLKSFISTGDLPDEFKAAAQEALDTAQTNLQWNTQYEKELKDYYGLGDSGVGRIGASFMVTLVALFVSKFFIY